MRDYLAVDWGTTNLRAWRISGGRAVETAELPLGVSKIEAGSAARVFETDVRPALGAERLPALMCGMIGSNLGWRAAPYVRCPAAKRELAQRVVTVSDAGPPVRIIPGLVCEGIAQAPDVMRGEETQLLGWIEKQPTRSEGRHVICHPGTHAKWALIEDGRITRFCTAMTGELYEVLSTHSLLRAEDETEDDLAFQQGVSAAGEGDALSLRLFTVRSRVVAGAAPRVSTASYLSGLLIGSEIGAAPRVLGLTGDERICVLGAADLRRHYVRALSLMGFAAWEEDGADAALAGFAALVELGVLDEA